MNVTRKKRSDRLHLIYLIRNVLTNDTYVGITVARGKAFQRSLKIRFNQHYHAAYTTEKSGKLYDHMRMYEEKHFEIKLVDTVRGRKEALAEETKVIQEMKATLNTKKV